MGTVYPESRTTYNRIYTKLNFLYGDERAESVYKQLVQLIGEVAAPPRKPLDLSERDALVIAYGDHVQRAGEAPLQTLRKTLETTIYPTVNGLHILPFYPYSSDDGFSVIDYMAVEPSLGTWDDVRAFKPEFRLMFDAVINHISSQSAWFKGFLSGDPLYKDYFIPTDPNLDLSLVTRPRALPLLSPFETYSGTQHLWTTFSDDQIDLNFANPDVLIAILRVLLFYIEQGADLIRLDAIAFMWKCVGTTCLHLPETHSVIQLMRDVLDVVAPHVILITETNVPHAENISYFGGGDDEAQMVYQFSLPPLTLHTFRTGDATTLSRWAATIERFSDRTTFFNFTASHDGIGVRPALGLLTDDEINALVQLTEAHGGLVSYKNNPDGTQSPYELNITYFDAITDPAITAVQPEIAVSRFICSQAIMLAMVGVPGIYLHSLFGSRNFRAGVEQTRRNRTINREKLAADTLLSELADETSLRYAVFMRYKHLLDVRGQHKAFHPLGTQKVLEFGKAIFALERISPDGVERVITLHNVSGSALEVPLPVGRWRDMIGGIESESGLTLTPYQVAWLVQL
jgi:sucrose phosphorylase